MSLRRSVMWKEGIAICKEMNNCFQNRRTIISEREEQSFSKEKTVICKERTIRDAIACENSEMVKV